MIRRFVPLISLFFVFAVAGDVMAQVPPNPMAPAASGQKAPKAGVRQPPLLALVRYLQLDQQQAANLKQLMDNRRTTLQPLMQQQKQYRQVISSSGSDPAAVEAATESLKALRAQLQEEQQKFTASFKALLTPDQAARFQTLQQAARLQPVIAAARRLRIIGMGGGPR